MPSITYTNPGFDPIDRRWRVACANGTADVTLTVGGTGLDRPTFTFENFPSASAAVALDGKRLMSDAGYFASYDAVSRVLYVTLTQKLTAGAHHIVIRTMPVAK